MNDVLDKIEMRVLADCNMSRLKEHRDCNYCHLCFDCKYYTKETGIDLCEFLDLELEKNNLKGEEYYV